ncbi:MAG: glycosyltransferase family 4 protein [Actinobacteria bacterium]|nr:glycosyltransferase family 4 protein [Actinomycetota bacterium]
MTRGTSGVASTEPTVVSLIVASAESEVYGGERSALAMLGSLNGNGYRAHVVTNGGPAIQALTEASGVPITHVPLKTPATRFRRARLSDRWRKAHAFLHDWMLLRRTFRRLGADIVHVNDISPAGQIGIPAAKLARIPSVIHVRTEVQIRRLHRLMLWLADASVTVSSGVLDLHLESIRGTVGAKRIARRAFALHNGVDIEQTVPGGPEERLAARARLGIDPDALMVLNVGSFEPRKRQLHLIEKVLPRIEGRQIAIDTYFVGGTKSLHESYLAQCEQAKKTLRDPSKCHLLGYSDRIQDYYLAADVVVLASLVEGLPRTVIEAMAFGRAVVAVASPGAGELIEPGRSGYLIDAEDDGNGFAHALAELAAMSSIERDAMGARGRRQLEADFDVRTVARRFREILDGARGVQ